MIEKDLDKINIEDIKNLIENKVPESETIDYKRSLHSDPTDAEENRFTDKDKEEFYADVVSFANKAGGDLIYGVAEEKGVPLRIWGLQINDPDSMKNKLEQMLISGIEPRIIPPPRIKFIKVKEPNYYIVIVRLREHSWAAPHRVKFKGKNKFYIRGMNGKYEMSIEELKFSFGYLEKAKDRIETFLVNRIENIASNNVPITLQDCGNDRLLSQRKGTIILHLIPLSAFHNPRYYDPAAHKEQIMKMKQIHYNLSDTRSSDGRYNIDGYCTHGYLTYKKCFSYIQFFRNGIIESVYNGIGVYSSEELHSLYINGEVIEKAMIDGLKSYLEFYKEIGVRPPVYLFVTILNAKDIPVTTGTNIKFISMFPVDIESLPKIDRNLVRLPELEIPTFSIDIKKLLKPTFDALWNASGREGSPNF